jgi:Protein kinase domain
MDAKRWGQIKDIYGRALDLSLEERERCIADACASDADLRREVESLLAAHADAGTFLESPAVEGAVREIVANELTSPAPQLIGRELANYRIVSLLGKGGMGEVYLAEDKRLHRKVALKLLPAKFTADADRVRRFEQEARSASALNHPNVIVIFEIGEADGAHYIATEYVAGQTLRQMMAGERMSIGAAFNTDGDALRSLTPDRDRPAPSPDDSASRSWLPDNPRLPFDHVRAFSDSLLLEQMNRPRRLTSRPSPSANRSENFHQLRTGDPRLCF